MALGGLGNLLTGVTSTEGLTRGKVQPWPRAGGTHGSQDALWRPVRRPSDSGMVSGKFVTLGDFLLPIVVKYK